MDFDKLLEAKATFQGADVGFCALGTTRGKSGVEGFIKVDHDYVVNAATAAKEAVRVPVPFSPFPHPPTHLPTYPLSLANHQGLKQFHVVTSVGSSAKSPMLYPQTKGRAEEDLKALGLPQLSIYRPGVLMCNRVRTI